MWTTEILNSCRNSPTTEPAGFNPPTPNLKPCMKLWTTTVEFPHLYLHLYIQIYLAIVGAYRPTACQTLQQQNTGQDTQCWKRDVVWTISLTANFNAQRGHLIILAIGWRIIDNLTGFQSANLLSSSITPLPLLPPPSFPSSLLLLSLLLFPPPSHTIICTCHLSISELLNGLVASLHVYVPTAR